MSSNGPITTDSVPFNTEPTLAFDALDLDLVLKVLSNTAFSVSYHTFIPSSITNLSVPPQSIGPFFTFFIPVLTYAQEQRSDLPTVYWGTVWFAFVTFFCASSPPIFPPHPPFGSSDLWYCPRRQGWPRWHLRNGATASPAPARALHGKTRLSSSPVVLLALGSCSLIRWRCGMSLLSCWISRRAYSIVVSDVWYLLYSWRVGLTRGMRWIDNVTSYVCDVSQWESVEAIAKQIVEEVSCSWSVHFDVLSVL